MGRSTKREREARLQEILADEFYHRPGPCNDPECDSPKEYGDYCKPCWQWYAMGVPRTQRHRHEQLRSVDVVRKRFEPLVQRGSADECWPFLGAPNSQGYGRMEVAGKHYIATHIALYLETGRFPKLCVLHECDNPICVNPNHLKEGTHSDNSTDMARKGRSAKATPPEKLRRVFELIDQGLTHKKISEAVGVSTTLVSRAKRRGREAYPYAFT